MTVIAAIPRCLGVLLLLLLVSSCATAIKGTEETVTIETDPQGAACDLMRDGEVVALVDQSPGAVEVERSESDIEVRCRLDGYEVAEGRLVAGTNNATMGNLVLGGLIGMAVDAASGANNEYPESISLVMVPTAFDTEEHRDKVYAKLKKQVKDRADGLLEDWEDQCGTDDEDSCLQEIEANRDREVAAL